MTSNACIARLQKELRDLSKSPLPGLRALPSPSSLLEWHYVLEGDKDSEYANGYYHGKIIFPQQYPFKPPAIVMLTPSGRFEPGAKICLSMSDFHPESWNPLWGVRLILLGLQSFFYENTSTTGALHGVPATDKRRLAAQSLPFNARNATFKKLFPELIEMHEAIVKKSSIAMANKAAMRRVPGPLAGSHTFDDADDGEAARDPPKLGLLGWRELAMGAAMIAASLGVALAIAASHVDQGHRTL